MGEKTMALRSDNKTSSSKSPRPSTSIMPSTLTFTAPSPTPLTNSPTRPICKTSPVTKRRRRRRKKVDENVTMGPVGVYDLDDESVVEYIPDFLNKEEADEFLRVGRQAKSWGRRPIKMFGKEIMQPRATALFGVRDYKYASCEMELVGWDGDLPASGLIEDVGKKVERVLGMESGYLNVVLANMYEDGVKDYMGFHSDDERCLGKEPVIASVSVGARRRFVLREKGGTGRKVVYWLDHGSLLVMKGKTQELWKHALPKDKGCHEVRLNFTFRHVVS